MKIIKNNKLCFKELTNTLIMGSTGYGKTVMACKLIDYCIKNNFNIALVDPKIIEYLEYKDYKNLNFKIANEASDMDNLADYITNYNSSEKLYVFIDECADVVISSRKLIDAINLKKDNVCVIACTQNPHFLKTDDINSFDYEIVLRLGYRLEERLETNLDTITFKQGEFIVKDLNTKEETDKINDLKIE